MSVPVYMDIEDAYRVVTGYGNIQGIRGLFAILQDMEGCWTTWIDKSVLLGT